MSALKHVDHAVGTDDLSMSLCRFTVSDDLTRNICFQEINSLMTPSPKLSFSFLNEWIEYTPRATTMMAPAVADIPTHSLLYTSYSIRKHPLHLTMGANHPCTVWHGLQKKQ